MQKVMNEAEQYQVLAAMLAPETGGPPDTTSLEPQSFTGPRRVLADLLKRGNAGTVVLEYAGLMGEIDHIFMTDPESPNQPTGGTWADMAKVIGSVSYQWPGWLPDGMLTMIAAESEMGKSILALRIAKCYLSGAPWPDGTPFTGQPGGVLWAEAESAQAINMTRAIEWGLPIDQIYTPFPDTLQDVILDNDRHREQLSAMASRPDIRLVIVDSLSGGNARTDENSAAMLGLVKWLAELAKNTGKPVILTHHLNKLVVFESQAITLGRVRGNSAIVQIPRVVWGLDRPDPNSRATRLSVIKSNLGKKPAPLGFTIDSQGPQFTSEAPEAPRVETLQDKAADLLKALLKRGPQPATKLEAEFKDAGLSWDAAQKAKAKLGIVTIRQSGHWEWALPASKELSI